jgi:omega-amidase
MDDILHIALAQYDIAWENRDENFRKLDLLLSFPNGKPNLLVLPEMFNTGFTMHAKHHAESMSGPSINWMKNKARDLGCHLLASLIICESSRYYNRLVWINPLGDVAGTYDKRHLFRMSGENEIFERGKSSLTCTIGKWRVRPYICYDIRFPVWTRNQDDYDVLVFLANWPASRQEVWNTLLKARAIENLSIVAGVNRVGKDGKDTVYKGQSMIVNERGEVISLSPENTDHVIEHHLDIQDLHDFRTKFPAHLDADSFFIP